MNADEKIVEFLKNKKIVQNATLSETRITSNQNKDGNSLLYINASIFEKPLGINYSNNSIYYGFDMNGNYVGCVKVSVLTPTQVEMEYWANEEYKNKGNMTVLAQEAIKDIFTEKVFDNLKTREGMPNSNIESIMVSINKDNLASLAVARKLGFDDEGYLYIDDYFNQNENKSIA